MTSFITTPQLFPTIPVIPTLPDGDDVSGLFGSAGQINQDILGACMVVIGLFVTFFGARFFKQIIFFVGFILGAFLTYYAVPIFFGWFSVKIADDTILYMSLIVGALCGILLVVVYKAAVFSVGAICGAIFSQILWIGAVSQIDNPPSYMGGVQIGVIVVFAIIGGYLAFKFVEQVLKGVTAFIGGFMFASGVAYFIGRIDSEEDGNVIDWVVFFGSYENYSRIDAVCDAYCIICIIVWIIMFAAGAFVQYKLHKKHKKKKKGEDTESDSESSSSSDSDSGSESDNDKKKKKKKRKKSDSDEISDDRKSHYVAAESQYGGYAPSNYAGSQYGGNRAAMSVHSGSQNREGPPNIAPTVAMSNYGANYAHGQSNFAPGPSVAHSSQYGQNGQRGQVQYV